MESPKDVENVHLVVTNVAIVVFVEETKDQNLAVYGGLYVSGAPL